MAIIDIFSNIFGFKFPIPYSLFTLNIEKPGLLKKPSLPFIKIISERYNKSAINKN